MDRKEDNQHIAVFMPTFKCRTWLLSAIESVVSQTYPYVDLYVADDASGDVDAHLISLFPNVTFLRMETAGGPYVIDNLLLRTTQSRFVAFQDADDFSDPRRFELQLQHMISNALDGCGTWSVHVDVFGDPIGYEAFPVNASEAIYKRNYYPVRHPSALLYRYVLDRIGGFDNEARFGGDSEYLFRAYLLYNFGNVQQFLYRHTIRPDSLTQSAETGFTSDRRKEFERVLIGNMEAILGGERPMPEPGILLDGRRSGVVDLPAYELLQLGERNQTWTGKAAIRETDIQNS